MSVCWALRPAWLPFGTDPGWMVSQLPSSSEVSGKGKPATEQKPETHTASLMWPVLPYMHLLQGAFLFGIGEERGSRDWEPGDHLWTT